jgi:hypothetical protein
MPSVKPNSKIWKITTRVVAPILLVSYAPIALSYAGTTATASNSADNVSANQQQATSAKWGITFAAVNADFTGSTGTFTSGGNPVVRTIPFVMTNVTTVDLAKWTMRTTTSNIGPNRNYEIKICTAAYTGVVCGGTETILQAASNTNVSSSNSTEAALYTGPTTYQGIIVVTRTGGNTTTATSVTLRATVTNISSNTDLAAATTVSN